MFGYNKLPIFSTGKFATFSFLLCCFCNVAIRPASCTVQLAPPLGREASLSGAGLPADATKFIPNIVPPESAHNASAAVVGATAAERNNASLLTQAVENGNATLVQTAEKSGNKTAAVGSGDIVTVQHGNQSTFYVAVSSVNATSNKTVNALVAGLPIVDLQAPWITNRRLPKDVVPLNYDIFVHPNLTTGQFNGDVACIFELLAPRNVVQLHSSRLNIIHMEIYRLNHGNTSLDVTPIPIANHLFYPQNEFLIIRLNQTAAVGRYILNIHYNGTMNNAINGLYRSAYKTRNNGEVKYMAVTQMEPTYARRVYPCFDEPAFKATFSISIAHAPELIALSNMPELERKTRDGDGLVVTVFEKSPPMSTYLSCFVVTDFKFIETRSSGGTLLRSYGIAEQVDKGNLNYSLDVLKYTVDRFEKYFEIPFQLPKLDIIGIPDFLYGAMENWGCITFRETNIVFDPMQASIASQADVATTVSHEVAHQWFGNLVTTSWWDSLWLNEGFATRMALYGVEGLNSTDDWSEDDWFVAMQTQSALRADAFISSHPIVDVTLTDPDDISATFDAIPYSKGGTILLMLEDLMGVETFRKGVVRYLNQHLFSNATSDDLWAALNEQLADEGCGGEHAHSSVSTKITSNTNTYGAGSQCVDVKQVMDTWILQMNYPMLNLTTINDTHALVQQHRFLISNNNNNNNDSSANNKTLDKISAYNYQWFIPITATDLDAGHKQLVWANRTSAVIELNSTSATATVDTNITRTPVVVLNVGRTGFYRVNYPVSMWTELADRLAANVRAVPDARQRSGLLSDAFEFARADLVPYSVPFSFMRYLKNERSPAVWLTATKAFKFLNDRLLSVPEVYYLWRQLIQSTIRPVFADLGWQDVGTSSQRRLRELLMTTACYYGDPDCLANTRQMFRSWLYNGTSVPPSFRTAVYKYGIVYAEDGQPWQSALERLTSTKTPQEVQNLLASLTSSSQPWQLQRLMYLGWNETYVRNQDIITMYEQLANNPAALPYAWNFYRNNLPQLVEKRTLNDAYLGGLPLEFGERFNEQMQLDEMKALFVYVHGFGSVRGVPRTLLRSKDYALNGNYDSLTSYAYANYTEKYPEAGAGRLSRRQALEAIQNNISWLRQHNATVIKWLEDQQLE